MPDERREEVTFINLGHDLHGVVLSAADEPLDLVKVVLLYLLALPSSPLAQFAQFSGQVRLDLLKCRLHDIDKVGSVSVSKVILEGS